MYRSIMAAARLVGGIAIVSLFTFGSPSARAQQQAVAPAPSETAPLAIYPGQPLDHVAEILTRRGVKFEEWFFDTTRGDPDQTNWCFVVDEDRTYVFVGYSKSRRVVSNVMLVVRPDRQAGKAHQTWLRATALFLYDDGTYAARFAAPQRREPASAQAPARQSDSPTFNSQTARPQ